MRKIPTAYIFLVPFVSGILFSKYFSFPEEFHLIFFVAFSIVTFILSLIFRKISLIFLVVFMFITGTFCTGYLHKENNTLPLQGEKITAVYGTVKDVREKGALISVIISNAMISEGKTWFKTDIKIRTVLPAETHIYVSDCLYLYDIKNVKKTSDSISITAKSWEITQPISPLNNFLKNIRLYTEKLVKNWFKYHPQEAAIFRMMVLGDKRQSFEIKEIFVKTGTYHLLIVSGIHLGYLVLFLRIIFFTIRRFEQAYYKIFDLIYLIGILFYSAITGFSTPVMRAALMFAIYLIAEIIERPVSSIDSISWAAFLILFFSPDELFNPGFQLSFSATTGIVLAMRNIPRIKKIPSWLDSTIRAITGAQIFTMPVLAINMGNFYPISFISNLFLVPIGGITVFLGLSFLIFGFLQHILIFPLIKMLEFFWLATKIFSTISTQISWTPGILIILTIYSACFALLFRNRWKIFSTLAIILFIAQFILPAKHDKDIQTIPSENFSCGEECIVIFPCKKLLCSVENKNRIILIMSERENRETIEPAIEKIKERNKEISLFFTGVPHDTIYFLELISNHVKPVSIIDNPEIKKNPAFAYRKCFFLADTGIKQEFWKFLESYEGLRVVYNLKDTQVLEYRTKKGTIIISNYMNSKIFEVLPFSPHYHTLYATNLALSNKLAKYLEEYETKQVLYQKIVYNTSKEPLPFKLLSIENACVLSTEKTMP